MKRLVLEIDKVGKTTRVNLSVLDEQGAGHGFRVAGPKYSHYPATDTEIIELDGAARSALLGMLAEVEG